MCANWNLRKKQLFTISLCVGDGFHEETTNCFTKTKNCENLSCAQIATYVKTTFHNFTLEETSVNSNLRKQQLRVRESENLRVGR